MLTESLRSTPATQFAELLFMLHVRATASCGRCGGAATLAVACAMASAARALPDLPSTVSWATCGDGEGCNCSDHHRHAHASRLASRQAFLKHTVERSVVFSAW